MSIDWKKYRLLVVEDDSDMRDSLVDLLSEEGCRVWNAANGKDALNILSEQAIDLVLSDVQMPIMDGEELLKIIREKDPKVPIVLLATGQSHLSKEDAVKAGACDLIQKPFDAAEIIKKIEHYLTLH